MNIFSRKKWVITLAMVVVIAVMTSGFIGAAAANDNISVDHVDKITYVLELEGDISGEFINIDAPKLVTEVIEYQDGDNLILRKRPGRIRCSNIILRSDLSNPVPDDLWMRYRTVIDGLVMRRSGSIILADHHGEEVDRYNIFHAWPCGWRVVTLEDKGIRDTVVIEIEIAVEEIYRHH